jgi:endonuclease-3
MLDTSGEEREGVGSGLERDLVAEIGSAAEKDSVAEIGSVSKNDKRATKATTTKKDKTPKRNNSSKKAVISAEPAQPSSTKRRKRKLTKAEIQKRVGGILAFLDQEYPDAVCSLRFENPFQLLIATILSAQCTDKRVNEVTKNLFQQYPDAFAFAEANPSELEEAIRSTGFFRNKAKNIINCAQELVASYGGEVPKTMEQLNPLAGVGRKTANVVLGDAFGVPGIVVDTHARRLSQRLGLTKEENPEKIELDLMKIIPKEKWTKFCHQLISHGRATCTARTPKCEVCALRENCDFGGE